MLRFSIVKQRFHKSYSDVVANSQIQQYPLNIYREIYVIKWYYRLQSLWNVFEPAQDIAYELVTTCKLTEFQGVTDEVFIRLKFRRNFVDF